MPLSNFTCAPERDRHSTDSPAHAFSLLAKEKETAVLVFPESNRNAPGWRTGPFCPTLTRTAAGLPEKTPVNVAVTSDRLFPRESERPVRRLNPPSVVEEFRPVAWMLCLLTPPLPCPPRVPATASNGTARTLAKNRPTILRVTTLRPELVIKNRSTS